MEAARFDANAASIRDLLQRGFGVAQARFGVAMHVNSVRQQPPGANRTFATYVARVGYALPDEPRIMLRMANGETSPHMLPIEIGMNEPIGASTRVTIDDRFAQLHVCTLEDIVAEKLRSLLQQPIRNRNRRQDVLDIAVIVRNHPRVNRMQIADHLILKSNARTIHVSKAAFRNPEIAARAMVDYAALSDTTRLLFIPFHEAFAAVLALVDELNIPDD